MYGRQRGTTRTEIDTPRKKQIGHGPKDFAGLDKGKIDGNVLGAPICGRGEEEECGELQVSDMLETIILKSPLSSLVIYDEQLFNKKKIKSINKYERNQVSVMCKTEIVNISGLVII